MPIREALTYLPYWRDGDHVMYNHYVNTISPGGVHQKSARVFLYRANTRTDITEWLLDHCIYNGVLATNDSGYLAQVKFHTSRGAMEFKLRWV